MHMSQPVHNVPGADAVLQFWFGELDEHGLSDDEHVPRWFKKSAEFDATVVDRFAADHEAARTGGRAAWLSSPRGSLAYIIVLDQFSRNMFRGDPGSWATDVQALAAAKSLIDSGADQALRTHERVFVYMPLMHSENIADQERCIALFQNLVDESVGQAKDAVSNNVAYAVMHRDIVARFGRFPHRNAILGRVSTPEEVEFLTQPGSSF